MHRVNVNNQFDFEIDIKGKEILVNDSPVELDSFSVSKDEYHFLKDNESYNVQIVSINKDDKTAEVVVNGSTYDISLKDRYDELLGKLGMDNLAINKVASIKAPMPGLVLNVLKVEGDSVAKGENVLVLEAMKMENIIKSPTDGVLQKINVKPGDKVEKNDVLVQFG